MPARNPAKPHSSTKEYYRLYYSENKDRMQAYAEKHKEKRKAYRRQHYIKNRERYLKQAEERRGKPDYEAYMAPLRRKSLMARYGITHEIYLEKLAEQGGKCAICGATETTCSKSKYFDVDHNHATGQVRGLLCRDCNVTAGVVEKKWDKIQLIRQYIAEWDAVQFDPKEKWVEPEDR